MTRTTMNADGGGTSEDEDKDKDKDDNDDVSGDDMLLNKQPSELPPLLSWVYDIECPDGNALDIPHDRGDLNNPTIPNVQHNDYVEHLSHTQTQVDQLIFKSHSFTSPLWLTAQALIIGLGLHSNYDVVTPLRLTYIRKPIDINPDPTQFTLGNHTTWEFCKL